MSYSSIYLSLKTQNINKATKFVCHKKMKKLFNLFLKIIKISIVKKVYGKMDKNDLWSNSKIILPLLANSINFSAFVNVHTLLCPHRPHRPRWCHHVLEGLPRWPSWPCQPKELGGGGIKKSKMSWPPWKHIIRPCKK